MSDLVERLVNLYHLRFVPTVKRMCARRRLAYTLLTAGVLCLSAATLAMLVLHGAGLLAAYAEMEEAFQAFLAESRTPVEKLPDMEKILASSKAASLVASGMGLAVWLILSVTAVGRIMASVIESEAYIYGLYMIYGSGRKQLRRQLSTEFLLEGVAALAVGIPLGYSLLPNRVGFSPLGVLAVLVGFLLLILLCATVLAHSILGRSCLRMLNAADTSDYTVSPRRSHLAGLTKKPRGTMASAALAVWRMRKHYISLALVIAIITALIFSMLSTEGQTVSIPAPALTMRFADGVDAETLDQNYLSYLHPSPAVSRLDYRVSGTAESLGTHVLVNEAASGTSEDSIRLGDRYATASFRIACGDGDTFDELGGNVTIPREFRGKELTDFGYRLDAVPVGGATYVYPEGSPPPFDLRVGDEVRLYLPSAEGVGDMTDRVANDRAYITVTVTEVVPVGPIMVEKTNQEVCPRITEDYLYLNPLDYGLFDGQSHAQGFTSEEADASKLFRYEDGSTCILVVPESGPNTIPVPSHVTVIAPTDRITAAFHDQEDTLPDDTYFVNLTYKGTGVYLGTEQEFMADYDAEDEMIAYTRRSLMLYKDSPLTPMTRTEYRVERVIYTEPGSRPYLILLNGPEVNYTTIGGDVCAFRLDTIGMDGGPNLKMIADEAYLLETDVLLGPSFYLRQACIGTYLLPHFLEEMKAHKVSLQFSEGWFTHTVSVISAGFSIEKQNYLIAEPYTEGRYVLGYLQAEEYPRVIKGTGNFAPIGSTKGESFLSVSELGAFGLFSDTSIGQMRSESVTIESLYARMDWVITPACETDPRMEIPTGHGILITDGDPNACPIRVGDTIPVAIRADTTQLLRDPEFMGLSGLKLLAYLLDRADYRYLNIKIDEIRQGEGTELILSEADTATVLGKSGVYEELDIYLTLDTGMEDYLRLYTDVFDLTNRAGTNATMTFDEDFMVESKVSARHDSRVLRQIGYVAVCMIPLLLLAAEMVFYEKREEEFDIFSTVGQTPRKRRRQFAAEWGLTACILGIFTAIACPVGYILTLMFAERVGATIPFSSFDPILYVQMLLPVLLSCLAAGLVTHLRVGKVGDTYRRRRTPHQSKEASKHHESSGM